MSENGTVNPLDAILQQYETNSEKSGGKPKISNEERLKKYFTEKLQKGEKEATKRFRLLPASDPTKSPFVLTYYHEMNVNGKWEKIHCTKENDGEPCALCEAREALMLDGSKKAKEMAKQYTARKFYVIKGIDRDNEDHGVKFWRFKHKWSGDGVMDKIMPLIKLKGNIMDPREGRDIIITTTRNDKGHSVVTSIMTDDVSLLTDPKSPEAKEWLGNDETWRDVYSTKSEEYVEIVAKQQTPVWDSELKKYVSEEDREENEVADLEEEINMMDKDVSFNENDEEAPEVEVLDSDDNDDELPF
jgi:hypothetical protein